jgi:GT2 family glycosyltransferase
MTTDTIIQNYQFHYYYNYVYMNKTIRFKKAGFGPILTYSRSRTWQPYMGSNRAWLDCNGVRHGKLNLISQASHIYQRLIIGDSPAAQLVKLARLQFIYCVFACFNV